MIQIPISETNLVGAQGAIPGGYHYAEVICHIRRDESLVYWLRGCVCVMQRGKPHEYYPLYIASLAPTIRVPSLAELFGG